jgi:hypothetical protein
VSSVLIIGHGSHPVLGELYQQLASRGRRRVLFIPLESYPQDVRFSLHQVEGEVEGHIALDGDEPIDFSDIVSVCVDGFQMVSAVEGLSEEDFAYRTTESWAALKGLFQCLSSQCFIANNISFSEHFDSRLGELQLLDSYQIPVPEVLITSDPDEARAFCSRGKDVVYRPVNGFHMPFRAMEESDLERLEEIALAPVHFEVAPTGQLAGCVLVGDHVFRNPRELEVPEELLSNFHELCRELGIRFAELRLCQSGPEEPWTALGMTPFLTEQGLADPEALEAALVMLEHGEVEA